LTQPTILISQLPSIVSYPSGTKSRRILLGAWSYCQGELHGRRGKFSGHGR